MEYGALRTLRSAPHVIVLGNGKGGTGKTTLAMHVAVGLRTAGWKVATLDLDTDQQCLTHYLDNRRLWAKHAKIDLAMPLHRHIASAEGSRADDNEAQDLIPLEHAERPVYRRLFPLGLTAFDPLPDALRETCNISHAAARNENEALMGELQRLVSARSLHRLAARWEWLRQRSLPLQLDEIVLQE